jgi:SRSO17 transposase
MTQARPAAATVTFVDEYCQLYQDLFPDVRSFEHFKRVQAGMLSEIKRKTLPAIAKATGESDPQALHLFVAYAPWKVEELRARRLTKLKQVVAGRAFILCIDETGDRKKGKPTDDVASQYIGNIGKLANGVVSVNAYGVLDQITFPLLFKVYKPHSRLKPEDTSKTKPELAVEIIEELERWGFQFEVVLADCVYGESSTFISALEKRHLKYMLVIRSNHGAWLPAGSRIRQLSWRPFERVFSNGEKQIRSIREIVFGWRRSVRFSVITIDPRTLPKDGT